MMAGKTLYLSGDLPDIEIYEETIVLAPTIAQRTIEGSGSTLFSGSGDSSIITKYEETTDPITSQAMIEGSGSTLFSSSGDSPIITMYEETTERNTTPEALTTTVITTQPTISTEKDTTPEALTTTVITTQPTISTEKDTTTETLTTAEITTQPTISTEKDTTTETLTTAEITTQPTISTEKDTTTEALTTTVITTQPTISTEKDNTTEAPTTTVISMQPTILTEKDTTTEALTTAEITTQPTISIECGTVTSWEGQNQPQGRPLGVRHNGVNDVVKGSAPWNARLYKHQSDIICGGTLINKQWVVTAASCFNDLPDQQNISVQISDHNEHSTKFLPVETIYRHESFDLRTLKNNIALVKLETPLRRFTNYVKPICLASQIKYSELVAGGALGRVTKWRVTSDDGVGSSGYLTEAFLPFVGYQVCKRHFRQRKVIFTPKMFCAGYSCDVNNAYSGEIGASYSIKDDAGQWYLTGILSRDKTYCRGHGYGVYTKYPQYHEWVQDKLVKFG